MLILDFPTLSQSSAFCTRRSLSECVQVISSDIQVIFINVRLDDCSPHVFSVLVFKAAQLCAVIPKSDDELVNQCKESVEDATSVLLFFIQHLVSQGNAKKSQLSTEFKSMLEKFLADYLMLLGTVDFPILEWSLAPTCQFLAAKLDNAELPIKTAAVDFLGSLIMLLEREIAGPNIFELETPLEFKLGEENFKNYMSLFNSMIGV
jgi:hypothetical protein